jgi:hypothetical protein
MILNHICIDSYRIIKNLNLYECYKLQCIVLIFLKY